jgi:hypothetical protein
MSRKMMSVLLAAVVFSTVTGCKQKPTAKAPREQPGTTGQGETARQGTTTSPNQPPTTVGQQPPAAGQPGATAGGQQGTKAGGQQGATAGGQQPGTPGAQPPTTGTTKESVAKAQETGAKE